MFKKTHKARYIRVVLKARTWKRAPMKLLKWKKKMTTKKQEYDLVTNDEYDTRIPLHPDEAFTYGITFEAKYIGTMDVPRPTSRVEIVAAMRRVRYEFKARGVKKRKVTVDVSIDGVRITTRSKAAGKRKTSTKFFGRKSSINPEGAELMHHPIYRIFYVSHDSSDLKIFSYIARDGATNVFKCNVFKSNRKSQAMRIVRTVGQAFEVCHKMQVNTPEQPAPSTSSAADEPAPSVSDNAVSKEAASECSASEVAASTTKVVVEEGAVGGKEEPTRPSHLDLLPPPPRKEGKRSVQRTIPPPSINLPDLPECVTKVDVPAAEATTDANTPLSAQHQLQLLRERLDQQAQQTRAAVAQLLLLRDQLAAEQAARCEAQARTHQLLVHNKELLEHIAALVAHLQDRERDSSRPISAQQLTLLPQEDNLAPLKKKLGGSTGKSGASLSGKSFGSKSGFGSSSNKSTSNKSSYLGSTASKSSSFGPASSKIKTNKLGSSLGKDSSARSPSFLTGGKVPSGLTPSTSRKTYETLSYGSKNAKASTSIGIIWLPGRKRNKKKDETYSSINNDKKSERPPTMYNLMSGDSPDYQLHKKKDEEANLLVPEKVKGPIATAPSAGAVTIITGVPSDLAVTDPEKKLLINDKEESKEAAGDANNKEDTDYLENKDRAKKLLENQNDKPSDEVDSVYISPSSGNKPPPPQSTTSNPDKDDCIVTCLYYTLQCCDCVLM